MTDHKALLAMLAGCVWMTAASPSATAQSPDVGAPAVIRDAELRAGGRLDGHLLDGQGQPQSDELVVIRHQGDEIARVMTDHAGRFEFAQLRGGVHVIATAHSSNMYRLWAPETAPPKVPNQVVIVAGQAVYNVQASVQEVVPAESSVPPGGGFRPSGGFAPSGGAPGGGGLSELLFNPLSLTLAAAIAIPVALNNLDDAS